MSSAAYLFPVVQPSEQNTYADIEAAYKCLEESYGAKQEDIILTLALILLQLVIPILPCLIGYLNFHPFPS